MAQYRLTPGDVVTLKLQSSIREIRIAPDGTAEVEPFGRIRLAGLTINESEGMLRELAGLEIALAEIAPSLESVTVLGHPDSIGAGAGKKTGRYPSGTLIEVISTAGGISRRGSSEVWVYFAREKLWQRFNIKEFRRTGDPTLNPYLTYGDMLFIPKRGVSKFIDSLSSISTIIRDIALPVLTFFAIERALD